MSALLGWFDRVVWTYYRAIGLFLGGVAYTIYANIAAERPVPDVVLFGQAPSHALIGYSAAAAAFAVPVVLPRKLVHPVSVIGGGLCAAMVAGLTLTVTRNLPGLIDHYDLAASLPTSIDRIQEAVFAASSALALGIVVSSFFRQLDGAADGRRDGKPHRALRRHGSSCASRLAHGKLIG